MKKELTNREDIYLLVNSFYEKVRKDEMLGPLFNSLVSDWPEHLVKLTDFWETQLLNARKYKGDPIHEHSKADKALNHGITMEHFGRWLHLWFTTIDEHFTGKTADTAKNKARNMSTPIFVKIFNNRP